MTGRRGRVVKTEKQPQPHYEARESDSSNVDSLNIQEVRILLEVKKKLQCQFNVFFWHARHIAAQVQEFCAP